MQARDGNLFLTTGDHFRYRDEAQNLGNHLGKVIRVTPDGGVPPDNPFVKRAGAKPEIWSYGHRNMQGAALQSAERQAVDARARRARRRRGQHPGGRQELRLAGDHLGHRLFRRQDRRRHAAAGMEQPVKYWVPSIAPSGMAFYTGDLFPNWRGNLFVGALAGQMLVRLDSTARRSARRSGCCRICASASATSGKVRTARSISPPTTPTAASCA